MDLILPRLNGLDTFLRIRQFRPKLVTIIISGHMEKLQQLADQAISEDALVCLEKPIDMDNFLKIVEKAISKIQDVAESS